jgi:outer membrane protein assembly factor BamA
MRRLSSSLAAVLSLLILLAPAIFGQQFGGNPLVRSWTIREVGHFRKIPTATLREKMTQRGVLFNVDEPYDQNKVDGTTLLLRQLYKDQGIVVTVKSSTIPAGKNAVKIEFVVNRNETAQR